jgi:hypothetical protein
MKFKFAPKGDYRPQQLITIAGVEYVVIEVAHTGRSLIAKTTASPVTHINVILTDAKPIEEIPATVCHTLDGLGQRPLRAPT